MSDDDVTSNEEEPAGAVQQDQQATANLQSAQTAEEMAAAIEGLNVPAPKTRGPITAKRSHAVVAAPKQSENKIVRLLEKNPLGMTLPEMAGGARQVKKIRLLRPLLAEAIRQGLVMPVSQRSGNTVYRLVRNMGPR